MNQNQTLRFFSIFGPSIHFFGILTSQGNELHDLPRKLILPTQTARVIPPIYLTFGSTFAPWHFQWSSDWSSAFICGFRAALFQKLGSCSSDDVVGKSELAKPMMYFKTKIPKEVSSGMERWNDEWSMECHAKKSKENWGLILNLR